MENIKRIAVLYGGSSSEREISLSSGQGVYAALCEIGYQCQLIDYKNLKKRRIILVSKYRMRYKNKVIRNGLVTIKRKRIKN